MGAIEIDQLTKRFPGGRDDAVAGVTLDIADGEFIVLVGPSGCGKSTLLRMIAGIEEASAGRIVIDGVDSTRALPGQRDVAMVFQNYALYPHMNVAENLSFGLKIRRIPKKERVRKTREVMRMLRLEELSSRKPSQLSGGQRQRVAIGRAMIREPAAYLMDEPLSNLDAKLRVAMRAELSRLHERLGVTTIYVTHDQTEAMTLGQRVVVLKDGVIQQVASPQELYDEPANLFVAGFIGSPAINLVEASAEGGTVCFGGHRIPVADSSLPGSDRFVLGIRPTDFESADRADRGHPRIKVKVDVVEHLGAEMHVIFSVDAARVEADGARGDRQIDPEESLLAAGGTPFTAVIANRSDVSAGEFTELALDTSQLRFFDRDSGLAVSPDPRPSAARQVGIGGLSSE